MGGVAFPLASYAQFAKIGGFLLNYCTLPIVLRNKIHLSLAIYLMMTHTKFSLPRTKLFS
jgi:hypothetical protein